MTERKDCGYSSECVLYRAFKKEGQPIHANVVFIALSCEFLGDWSPEVCPIDFQREDGGEKELKRQPVPDIQR